MRCIPLWSVLCLLIISPILWSANSQQNQAPGISLGSVPLLTPGNTLANLSAIVTDDGLPMGSTLTYSWCKFTGPGPVVFATPTEMQTTAQFDQAGVYDLIFSANDGVLVSTQTITVTVQQVANLPIAVTNILNSFANPSLDPLYADRFLTFIQNTANLNATGASYYAAVDPLNQKTTFAAFKATNGFIPGSPALVASVGDSMAGCCTAGVYGNAGDLGFGRRMVMARDGGDIAFWVTNYFTVHDAVVEDPAGVILTVCMEYTATPGAQSNSRYVKFYMYDASGNRITDVNFDGRGPKPAPLSCAVCHGGVYAPGGTIPTDGRMGSFFMPFDLDQFDFSCEEATGREAHQTAFREFNGAILQSDAPATLKNLIKGWYGGFGLPNATQNSKWVPPGWKTEPELYRQVVAPSCRNCHLTRTSATLDFDSSTDFAARQSQISGSLVFGPSPSGFRMPHAEATWERFWLSTTPHQPAVLTSAFNNGVFVGLGTPAGRVYVDATAVGANDGTTWADAYVELSTALSDASTANSTIAEIWVASGTYLPDITGLIVPRDATFSIPDGVAIYGGFVSGDLLLEDRIPGANPSVMSGDLNGDDLMVGKSDNVFHVVTFNQVSGATRLDGFEIRGGNAMGALDPRGGGIYMIGGGPLLVRNNVVDNIAPSAGGMFVDGSGPTLVATSFYGNNGDTLAGGIWMTNASDVTIENSIFSYNLAEGVGGEAGFCLADGGTLRLRNCTMFRNYSLQAGGGLIARNGASIEVSNSIFWHNCTNGVRNEDDQILLDNSMGAVSLQIDFTMVDGLTGGFGGINNTGADPLFVNGMGVDGILGTLDDDLRLQDGSPLVDAGNNDLVPVDRFDLDVNFDIAEKAPLDGVGMRRFFDSNLVADTGVGAGAIVDFGAVEMINGSLAPCGAGNIRVSVDGPHDVVRVNGSTGGSSRLVYVGTGDNLTISVSQPPGQLFAPFALFIHLGTPRPSDVRTLDFGIGDMCFTPSPLLPFETGDFVLADNLGLGFGAALPSTPAPWLMPTFITGLEEADFAVQGLIWDDTKVVPLSVTNGVLVSIRENPPVNLVPQAVVADSNFQAFANAAVNLDGSMSFDPEGATLNYAWVQTAGTMVTLTNPDQAIASFVAPPGAEILQFELTVDDAVNTSAPGAVSVQIVLNTPIADAGPDQSVITNSMVALDGSGSSDPQMDPITYSWTQVSGTPVVLTGANTIAPTFTTPSSSDVLVFQLIVDDGGNMSSPDNVTVTVLTSFANDVYPIFSTLFVDCGGFNKVCINCHDNPTPAGSLLFDQSAAGVYTALQSGRVDIANPSQSLVLRKPLAVAAGGASHGGGDIFCSIVDPSYVTILNWIIEGALNN